MIIVKVADPTALRVPSARMRRLTSMMDPENWTVRSSRNRRTNDRRRGGDYREDTAPSLPRRHSAEFEVRVAQEGLRENTLVELGCEHAVHTVPGAQRKQAFDGPAEAFSSRKS